MIKSIFKPVYNRRKKEGESEVEIYCYVEGRKKYISTGIRLKPGEWDKKNRRVTQEHPNQTRMDYLIKEIIRKLEQYELDILNDKGCFSYSDLENYTSKGPLGNFIEYLSDEITQDYSISPSTRGYRFVMLEKLKGAIGNRLPLSGVKYEMIQKFNNYMSKEGLKVSTMKKHHQQLRKFCQIAVLKGFIKENPYNHYKVKRPPTTTRKCLWYDDLDRLWELNFDKDSPYELVRLKFLFSCYTGLRISDNGLLEWRHIREGKIFMNMQKTERSVTVPLNVLGGRAQEILDRLKEIYDTPDRVFPKISDPEVNRYLKVVGIKAEAPFALNFHVSRHTFCTLVADQSGSVYTVMRMAGLQRVETAGIYVNLSKLFK